MTHLNLSLINMFHLKSSELLGHPKLKSFPTSALDNYKLLKAKASSSHHKILNLNEVKYTVASSWDTDNN